MSSASVLKVKTIERNRAMCSDLVMNHVTVREQMDLRAFIPACAERGVTRLSLWSDEIEKIGAAAAKDLLKTNGCSVSGFHRAGPLLANDAAGRGAHIDAARRIIDMATEFEADHCFVFAGGLPDGSRDLKGARAEAEASIGVLLNHARQQDMTLAIEPLHPMLTGDRSCIVTMSHANDMCDRLGPGIGIVVDVYHVWWDDRLEVELKRAGRANRILGFHVSDWLVPTRHTLRDRGMMGDGIIDLQAVWQMVRQNGYRGPIEVEIFSDDWWAKSGEMVLDAAIEGCERVFGAAHQDQ